MLNGDQRKNTTLGQNFGPSFFIIQKHQSFNYSENTLVLCKEDTKKNLKIKENFKNNLIKHILHEMSFIV